MTFGGPKPTQPLANLFSPIKIGRLRLKNRLVMAPMATNFSTESGDVTQRQIDYYVERARGRVGLIVCEAAHVSPNGSSGSYRLGLHSDDMVAGHRRLVEGVHRENTPIMAQLQHAGRGAAASASGRYPLSASSVPLLVKGELGVGVIPRAASIAEIQRVVEQYAEAARRAVAAGYDGISVHAGHGYLPHQFLSPQTNKRSDLYGGSGEKRARFLLEIVRRIREVVGPEVPLSVRLTGEERVEGGYGVEYTCRVAEWLAELGVDEIGVTSGNAEDLEWTSAPRSMDEGHNVAAAARVRASVKVPVSVAGRIKRPEMANRIIEDGHADLVWMGRALIADPYLARKAEEGRLEDIRECLSCNSCLAGLFNGLDVRCSVNPEAGKEREMTLVAAETPRRVLVVGGGPAGMEAARVAALRGHQVTLAERSDRLGGQLLVAAAAPRSEEMERFARYLARQAEQAGAKVLAGVEIAPGALAELRPEVVIVATGARPVVPEIPGSALPHVGTAHDVLSGRLDGRLGRRVVVMGGGLTGVETALWLVERGHEVTIVEMLDWLMADGNFYDKRTLTQELGEAGVMVLVKSKVEAITGQGVVVERAGEREVLPADSVIIAAGVRSDRGLLGQLDVDQVEVHVIGDAQAPRRIREAVGEGASVGRRV